VVLAAGSLLASQVSVQAQTPNGMEQAQTGRTATFDIPAQPLGQALTAFGQQAGVQVGISASAVAGKTSTAVSGTMALEQALQQLLAGTGVGYRFTSPNVVTVSGGPDASGAVQLDPVQVQGYPVPPQAMIDNIPPPYAGGQVATGGQLGILGNRSVMDTPFNQSNYTSKKAQDQQAVTVRDVLIDDPSVRAWAPVGGSGQDNFRIRGFDAGAGANISYGGLFGLAPIYSIMPEMAERIEVLKGPSAMLNGMLPTGAIGGSINIVPKRAPAEPLTQATASYISNAQFGGHIDFARRFGADSQFGARFNGAYRSGQTPVQYNSDERALAVLGLDFRGERLRVSADLGYQYQYVGGVLSYLGVNPGVPLPYAPDATINQGQPWNFNKRKDLFGVVRAEVDLTDQVTAFAAFGAHDFRFEGLFTFQVIATNFNGNALGVAPQNFSQYRTFQTGEAGVRARAETGPIEHELAVVATTYANQNGFANVTGAAFNSNFYNPSVVAVPNLAWPAAPLVSRQGLSGVAIADTLSAANKRIQLTLGGRLQQVAATNFNPTGAPTSGYDQSALTPSVALIFKPWENVSFYGNYIQGLQPGAIIGPGFANAGEVLPPYKSTQYEVGVKVDWGRFTTTASAFQISQPTILTNVTANTQFLGGEQRNQGLEFNVFGEPVQGVRLLGGLMLLNAVLTKTQGGLTDGWIAPSAPGVNLNLAGEWDLPFVRGLTVNGRVIYTGSQYIDTTWPRRSLPEWTRVDLGARYAFENPGAKGKLLVARFNVENVFGTSYWEAANGATVLNLGAPRTFRVSLTADF
jgi:iron complex outermembrane receptor protein